MFYVCLLTICIGSIPSLIFLNFLSKSHPRLPRVVGCRPHKLLASLMINITLLFGCNFTKSGSDIRNLAVKAD